MDAALSKIAEYCNLYLYILLSGAKKDLWELLWKTKSFNYTGSYLSLKLSKQESDQVNWDFNQKTYPIKAGISFTMS